MSQTSTKTAVCIRSNAKHPAQKARSVKEWKKEYDACRIQEVGKLGQGPGQLIQT
jgi:hypothetical protein